MRIVTRRKDNSHFNFAIIIMRIVTRRKDNSQRHTPILLIFGEIKA